MDERCRHTSLGECLNSEDSRCDIPCKIFMQYCFPEEPSELDSYEIWHGIKLLTSMRRLRSGALEGCAGCLLLLDAITAANDTDLRQHDFGVIVSADFDGPALRLNMWYHPDRQSRRRGDPPDRHDIHLEVFAVKGTSLLFSTMWTS